MINIMGEIAILGRQGDVKQTWDKNKPDEVDAARTQFDSLRKRGYLAFEVDKVGEKGKQIFDFNSNAERIILAAPMQGG